MKIQTDQTTLVVSNSALSSQIWGVILITAGIAAGVVLGSSPANRTYGIIVGIALVAFGLFALLLSRTTKITLDKSAATTTAWQKRLLGAAKVDTAPLATIVGVVLSVGYDDNTSSNSSSGFRTDSNSRRSRLYLAQQGGGRIELGTGVAGGLIVNGLSAGSSIQNAPLTKEAQQIAEFLGLPVSTQDFTAAGSIAQVRDILTGQQPAPSVVPTQPTPAPSTQQQAASESTQTDNNG